ncbi:hypothetical protein FA95DRAFT_1682568 [Auriscalpium vulgare]|uniref:Uncharacterized protein n=1 Tax=Auriscalpium vulgare TaxID=40419 RepID=A0ACB8REI6_9AGAM|nr:hypothetical protein FA95DRAFT_1682568 [Auriscalpium vulgare]
MAATPNAFWADALRSRLPDLARPLHPSLLSTGTDILYRADQEYRAIRNVLSSLACQRNQLVPVYRLAPETLAHIFSLCAQNAPHMSRRGGRVKLGWIQVTHVCRLWRDIALDCAGLWTDIFLHMGESWTKAMLERSKLATLHVSNQSSYFPLPMYVTRRQADDVRAQLFRIRGLDLHMVGAPIADMFTSSTPQLETLMLRGPGTHELSPYGHEPISLSTPFLGDDAPRLRVLDLRGLICIAWTSPVFNSLVSLSVKFSVEPDSIPPSRHLFYAALGRMGSLESLHFGGSLPRASAHASEALPVELRSVKNGYLCHPWRDAVDFVAHFRFCIQYKVSVELVLDEDETFTLANHHLLLPLLDVFLNKAPYSLPAFKMTGGGGDDSVLTLSADREGGPRAHLCFSWGENADLSHEDQLAFLEFLVNSLSFHHEAIEIDFDLVPFNEAAWHIVLSRPIAPYRVATTLLSGITLCRALAAAIGTTESPAQTSTDASAGYSKLRTLSLINVEFRRDDGEDNDVPQLLCDWLKHRAALGNPLSSLWLETCVYTDEDLASWKAASPETEFKELTRTTGRGSPDSSQ